MCRIKLLHFLILLLKDETELKWFSSIPYLGGIERRMHMKKLLVITALSIALICTPMVSAKGERAEDLKQKRALEKKKKEHKKDHKKKSRKDKKDKKKRTDEESTEPRRLKSTQGSYAESFAGAFGGQNVASTRGAGKDRVIGQMNTSKKPVYEGPQGGHYYVASTGTKEYVDETQYTKF
jgi:colicin import membrane protein